MQIDIKKNSRTTIDIFVDGKSILETVDFETRAELLDRANKKLDQDVDAIAEIVKDEPLGGFFWCFTYDIHRHDCIKGTVIDYFLVELISFLQMQTSVESINTCYHLKPWVAKEIEKLTELKITDEVSKRDKIFTFLRMKLGPIKHLINYYSNFLHTNHTIPEADTLNSVFIFYNLNDNLTRLKGFGEMLGSKKQFSLHTSLNKLRSEESSKVYSAGHVGLKKIWDSLVNAWRFKWKTGKLSLINKSIFYYHLKNQSFLQSFYIFLRWEALKQLFDRYSPSELIIISTFGDPVNRLPLAVAKQRNISTVLFSCRPMLSSYRPEDRVIDADLGNYNDTSIGDSIVIFDKISRNHLIKSNINNSLIYTFSTSPFPSNSEKVYEDAILVLFANRYYNALYIEYLKKLKKRGFNIGRLLYREHPSHPLFDSQKEELRNLSDQCESLADLKWNDFKLNNVLTFVCDSTAAIDAISRGGSVLWIPYLSYDSMMFKTVMNTVGDICENESELLQKIISYFADDTYRQFLNSKCYGAYSTEFAVSDTTEPLINSILED